MTESNLVTRYEAASLLRVSLRTLDNLVSAGAVPQPVCIGGRRKFFHREILDQWVRSRFGISSEDKTKEVPQAESESMKPRRRGRPRKS